MAEREHLRILALGVPEWNQWRAAEGNVIPDLSGAVLGKTIIPTWELMQANQGDANINEPGLQNINFRNANLASVNLTLANLRRADMVGANLRGASLAGANCIGANLSQADLSDADLRGADLRGAGFSEAHFCRANLHKARFNNLGIFDANFSDADLGGADLSESSFRRSNFSRADFRQANLSGTDLSGTNLRGANLSGLDLTDVNLSGADLMEADLSGTNVHGLMGGAVLRGANFTDADIMEVDLKGVDLSDANLSGANLRGANLVETNLTRANLCQADLSTAILIRTNFENADLTGCRVYGSSAWDLKLTNAVQKKIVITPENEPTIQVDQLNVAQFIYLLLNNTEIRNVIDTITSKVVLILGRFTEERKAVLDALLARLRERDYLPILFDWEKPSSRDITETVSTLAHMAKFVIADITDAKSIPQELMAIVPNLPSVPVQPLLLASQSEYAMFEHFRRFPWVLPVVFYKSKEELVGSLEEKVIIPAETRLKELLAASVR